MTLTPGAKLGPYEVVGPLGAGGMGEVFRARDPRLGRDVAIKALPAAFAQDPERLARFEREAKLLASLNHPNVAGIHGVEEVDGTRYLVLEFVDGETLEAHVQRGALPLAEVLDVARQVAAGVEAAHEAGVVHRDLKPGNVMLTASGGVKVLDFGLAKGGAGRAASGSDPKLSASPTMTYAATQAGMILGTAAYMSPEQARGRAVDRRTDIWSFGCVLYEMLAGKRAYEGETVSDMVAKILEREPDWAALPASLPPRLVALLRRCMVKDAKQRVRDIGDVRLELEAIAAGDTGAGSTAASAKPSPLPWALAAVALVVAIVATVAALTARSARPIAIEAELAAPAGMRFARLNEAPMPLAMSPDGQRVVFAAYVGEGPSQLWVRDLRSARSTPIPGTERGSQPFFSPDGRSLGFMADGSLKRVDFAGGPAVVLAPVEDPRGGAWGADGQILFSAGSAEALKRVSAAGGPVSAATTLDSTLRENTHRFPYFLPDGRHFLYLARRSGVGAGESPIVYAQEIGRRERTPVLNQASNVTYSAGHLLFVREGSLFAQRFDPGRLKATGDPTPVLENVRWEQRFSRGAWATSPGGALVAFTGGNQSLTQLEWFDRTGRSLGAVGEPASYTYGGSPDLSPDGRSVLLGILDANIGASAVWVVDLASGRRRRVTVDDQDHPGYLWMPGGGEILVNGSLANGDLEPLMRYSLDGQVRDTLQTEFRWAWPGSVTRDGRQVLFTTDQYERGIMIISTAPGDPPRTWLAEGGSPGGNVDLSPDDRFVAYRSEHGGGGEIFVTTFPEPTSRWQVSQHGGRFPRWSRDGRELYYVDDDNHLVAVDVHTSPNGFEAGESHVLFQKRPSEGWRYYTPGPDRERFLFMTAPRDSADVPIQLLTDWTTRLAKQ